MTNKLTNRLITVEVCGKICYIYKSGVNPCLVFYWGIGGNSKVSVETAAAYLEKKHTGKDFVIAAYEADNWNDDFSPWKAQPVFGNGRFCGNADKTLDWLTNYCIPYIEADDSGYINGSEKISRFTVGYSLAGLFALWAYSKSSLFAGAVSCSGSLWYEGWIDYVYSEKDIFYKAERDETSYVYLSLGSKEEKTKNIQMKTVGSNTRAMYEFLCEDSEHIKCTLEWNEGGHFAEPDIRIAKGIYWILMVKND